MNIAIPEPLWFPQKWRRFYYPKDKVRKPKSSGRKPWWRLPIIANMKVCHPCPCPASSSTTSSSSDSVSESESEASDVIVCNQCLNGIGPRFLQVVIDNLVGGEDCCQNLEATYIVEFDVGSNCTWTLDYDSLCDCRTSGGGFKRTRVILSNGSTLPGQTVDVEVRLQILDSPTSGFLHWDEADLSNDCFAFNNTAIDDSVGTGAANCDPISEGPLCFNGPTLGTCFLSAA